MPVGPVTPPPGLDACAALFRYQDAGAELIWSLKYRGQRASVAWLGRAMAVLAATADLGGCELVTWAPTTTTSARRRGFDQARCLADRIGRELGLPVAGLLTRVDRGHQHDRIGSDRWSGPVFGSRGRPPTSVLVVDDVLTTGATLAAASVALRRSGVAAVLGLVAAQTPLKSSDSLVEATGVRRSAQVVRDGGHGERARRQVQPTEIQVQRSLIALQGPDEAPGVGDCDGSPTDSRSEVPEGLVELLSGAPAVRLDRLADARRRMTSGDQPTDDDLAGRLVGRLVCDRLR